ncbi:MAG: hypothetical protein KAT37_03720 [Candidatus Aenigmarchaeota archaeon]|nr:hypothetical protein [Candidatus Aenigmarchaeota archaeon]
MDWKKEIMSFLKPDWRKILIVVILVALSFLSVLEIYIPPNGGKPAFPTYIGLPLPYFNFGSFQTAGNYEPKFAFSGCNLYLCQFELPSQEYLYFNYIFSIMNFIFWYLLACLIIYTWGKYRGKKKSL